MSHHFHTRLLAIPAFILLLFVTACSKDSGDNDPEPEEPPKVVVTGVYSLTDVAADTVANSGSQAKPMYFSLEDNRVVSENLKQTDKWDIAFTGTYNSNIAINNGSIVASPGYGGPGKGAIYMEKFSDIDDQYYDSPNKPIKSIPGKALFNEAFTRVKAGPAAADFKKIALIGLDYFSGSEDGWAYYDFYGQLFPGSDASLVAHVSYTLPRPIIVKTAKGNYAKIVVYSVYKGAPAVPSRNYKPGYVTFKYAIQKDGTANLDISE
ncbi:MAG: HmuY family protein [Candidatus Pseudobacter hemicellulosilyticus]|uniref:HmuY family protein n=1 Tax=Candidatus Pseudobacter hemicellulosilyticus TaxID=3121375 RepID=A0AAJ5WW33_9BACT|nr:MAG: HmuY family protein [Pseudobacter sp.]